MDNLLENILNTNSLNASDMILFALLLLCFLSFWYSSLKIFNQKIEFKILREILLRRSFKVLTLVLWNSSLFCLAEAGHFGISTQTWQFQVAVALFLISLLVFWWSAFVIRSHHFDVIFSPRVPRKLVTTGPYKWVRHPFYTSYILCYSGVIILNLNIVTSLLSTLLIFYYVYEAQCEEKKIIAGPDRIEYLRYRQVTSRFLPFIF